MTKYTKDDYFAAASTHDLWTCIFNGDAPYTGENVLDICGANHDCYLECMSPEIYDQYRNECLANRSFIIVQLACEKAGL